MNRVIKFRAWDVREGLNKMYYNVSFIPYGDGWSGGNPDHKFYQIYHGNGGFFLSDMKNIVLMQFTGLHDKNGKEIYEGDVVEGSYFIQRSLDPDSNPEIVFFEGTINFSEGCFYVKNNEGYFSFSFSYSDYEIEVIGNIYENPELLHNK